MNLQTRLMQANKYFFLLKVTMVPICKELTDKRSQSRKAGNKYKAEVLQILFCTFASDNMATAYKSRHHIWIKKKKVLQPSPPQVP